MAGQRRESRSGYLDWENGATLRLKPLVGNKAHPITEIHVIGAGIAGLAASVRLLQAGHRVILYDAAPHAGGRARSWNDGVLGAKIDNGNHLMLSANHALREYLRIIGACGQLSISERAIYHFIDPHHHQKWQIDFGRGWWPGWIFQQSGRPKGWQPQRLMAEIIAVMMTRSDELAGVLLPQSPHYAVFWQPLCLAIMNLDIDRADRRLLARVLRESALCGGAAMRPMVARDGLSDLLIDPALDWLKKAGADWRPSSRLQAITHQGGRVQKLHFSQQEITIPEQAEILLAVPWGQAAQLLDRQDWDLPSAVILNAHFRWPGPEECQITGLVGTVSQWVFQRRDITSVTISAATKWQNHLPGDMLKMIWREIALLVGGDPADQPIGRLIKEKNATFRADPATNRRRPLPGRVAGFNNLLVAGDWTQTGLPSTLEGSVRSGFQAARMLC